MWLNEIEDNLPNGFHDAIINSVKIDFIALKLEVQLQIDKSDCELEDSLHYQSVLVTVTNLKSFQFDMPSNTNFKSKFEGQRITSTGCEEKVSAENNLKNYYFFLPECNSFIRLVGEFAEISIVN